MTTVRLGSEVEVGARDGWLCFWLAGREVRVGPLTPDQAEKLAEHLVRVLTKQRRRAACLGGRLVEARGRGRLPHPADGRMLELDDRPVVSQLRIVEHGLE